MKIIKGFKHNTPRHFMFWINDKYQIFRDPKDPLRFGYYDAWKTDGILEDGAYIKSFFIGRTTFCWCDGEVYRKKYNISHEDWTEIE